MSMAIIFFRLTTCSTVIHGGAADFQLFSTRNPGKNPSFLTPFRMDLSSKVFEGQYPWQGQLSSIAN